MSGRVYAGCKYTHVVTSSAWTAVLADFSELMFKHFTQIHIFM